MMMYVLLGVAEAKERGVRFILSLLLEVVLSILLTGCNFSTLVFDQVIWTCTYIARKEFC